mgnify:FL=1
MADLKTNLLGFVMNSPVIGASGTVGYGVEYEELADFAKIGGISGKGLTLHGQYGNKGERLWETPSGLINSIGILQQVMPVQRATLILVVELVLIVRFIWEKVRSQRRIKFHLQIMSPLSAAQVMVDLRGIVVFYRQRRIVERRQ